MQLAHFLEDERAREQREHWRDLSFLGWQHYIAQPNFSDKPDPKKSFGEYLTALGLREPSDTAIPSENDADMAARLIAQAESWLKTADPGRFDRVASAKGK